MKHKISELDDYLLDAAVAKAKGDEPGAAFSVSWHHGGPIISQMGTTEVVQITGSEDEWTCSVGCNIAGGELLACRVSADGHSPLVAAMRAYVASRFGDEVELPD